MSIKTILIDAFSKNGFQKVLTRLRLDPSGGLDLYEAYENFLVRWISATEEDWTPTKENSPQIPLQQFGFRVWELQGNQACELFLNSKSKFWILRPQAGPQAWVVEPNNCGPEVIHLLEIAAE